MDSPAGKPRWTNLNDHAWVRPTMIIDCSNVGSWRAYVNVVLTQEAREGCRIKGKRNRGVRNMEIREKGSKNQPTEKRGKILMFALSPIGPHGSGFCPK